MKIITSLSERFLIKEDEMFSFINSAPHRYKTYEIPKRNGHGTRLIAQPSKELKVLQKLVIKRHLEMLPVHVSAMAYRDNISIKDNAEKHSSNSYLLKMDFSNFFPSIKSEDFLQHVERHLGETLEETDSFAIKKLFFWVKKGKSTHRLSIGAPSSPFISNTIMFEFDSLLSDVCEEKNIIYTRYADDLTLTTNTRNILPKLPAIIKKLLKDIDYPKLNINEKKTVLSSKKNNRHVTGLVLTNNNTVSLGRRKKREIKSLVYRYTKNQLGETEISHLHGLLAYAFHIEPKLKDSLSNKFSHSVIYDLTHKK